MTICYFGMYAPEYSANRILLKGLRQNEVGIIECNDRSHLIWGLRYFKLIKKFFCVKGWRAETIFVGFHGATDMPLAWTLAKIFRKRLIFNAFYSLYCSFVFDRKQYALLDWKAKVWFFIDWQASLLADKVRLDTKTHVQYYIDTFHLPKNKFLISYVGVDNDLIKPMRIKPHREFVVGFHGSYLPLQGVDIIAGAADFLRSHRDIRFDLVGNGIERKKIAFLVRDLQLSNIRFLDPVPLAKLPHFISSCDIYLGGPFGNNLKSGLVIPNKVYEAMAVKKPVIVGDTNATRELFTNKVHCLFVKQGDAKELAAAISELKKNKLLREKIASNGYNLVVNQLNPKKIAAKLLYELNY